jgi:hypothetical protein
VEMAARAASREAAAASACGPVTPDAPNLGGRPRKHRAVPPLPPATPGEFARPLRFMYAHFRLCTHVVLGSYVCCAQPNIWSSSI